MTTAPVRVLVVDDSAVVRSLWARVIDAEPDLRVVASAWNGRAALNVLGRREIDVVLLDIEMPEMSGMEALPLILSEHPGVKVVMASSHTERGAEVTLRALSLGAADYVTKPSASDGLSMESVSQDLVLKVRALGRPRRRPTPSTHAVSTPTSTPSPRVKDVAPRVLAMTSSTGGPNALTTVLSALPASFALPILIVQHMPPLFTGMLATRLQQASGRPCVEAKDGMLVEPGHTYVAPGDFHMTVVSRNGGECLALDQNPPENFCRPSADPLFRSVAAVYGAAFAAVVLTGMGQDGLEGARALASVGGRILVQDQASSVVWGMPGAVANAGLAHRVLPLDQIAATIDDRVSACL